MGADTKYSVSFLLRFFYFLCHYLGAYHTYVHVPVTHTSMCQSHIRPCVGHTHVHVRHTRQRHCRKTNKKTPFVSQETKGETRRKSRESAPKQAKLPLLWKMYIYVRYPCGHQNGSTGLLGLTDLHYSRPIRSES